MKKVAIIGAGITGLCAGVFARRAGHEVTVLESGGRAGGLSSSWDRGPYHFEGGIHWLVGSSRNFKFLNDLWNETGALRENNPISFRDPVITLHGNGEPLSLRRDVKAMRREFLRHAPGDRHAIDLLCLDIRSMGLFQVFGNSFLKSALFVLCSPLILIRIITLLLVSNRSYVGKFKNDDLRALLGSVIDIGHNAASLIYIISAYCVGDSGYPAGGAQRLAANIEQTCIIEGVDIRYSSRVSRVAVENGSVKGVVSNGEFIPADEVIVTCDTCRAVETLFEERLEEKWVARLRDVKPLACMFFCFGVKANLGKYDYSLRIVCDEPVFAGGLEYRCLPVYNYSEMEGYAPEGCTPLTVILHGDTYEWWASARSAGRYAEAKQQAVDSVLQALEARIPEIKGNVEVTDMATPLTYERYCDTYHGSWMSIWQAGRLPAMIPPECRTVRGLHFAGQRAMLSGGLPIAIQTARNAVRSIRD